MARARNIKPGFFLNEDLGDLSCQTRLVFIGLWTLADFKGCLAFKPRRIKASVMPYEECDIEAIAQSLAKANFVTIYTVNGERYLKIHNFAKHQRPHKNEIETGSDIPDTDQADAEPSPQVQQNQYVDASPNKSEPEPNKSEPVALNTDTLNLDSPIPDSLSGDTPSKEKKPTLESFSVSDELRTWAEANGITADLDIETEQWRDHHLSVGTKIRDAKASWRKWMRNTVKFAQSKPPPAKTNGYDPTKDIMHPDYKVEKPRKTFTEAADHVLDKMPDKYEEMKVNWLTMPWVKGYEYEIEEYERSSPRYQRYCETRQALASASVN